MDAYLFHHLIINIGAPIPVRRLYRPYFFLPACFHWCACGGNRGVGLAALGHDGTSETENGMRDLIDFTRGLSLNYGRFTTLVPSLCPNTNCDAVVATVKTQTAKLLGHLPSGSTTTPTPRPRPTLSGKHHCGRREGFLLRAGLSRPHQCNMNAHRGSYY